MAKWRSLTGLITGITLFAWVLALILGQSGSVDLWAGFIPARMSGSYHLLHAVPAWLTPLSATLVHSGLMHVAFNMVMLIFCGRQVEAVLGWRMLALLYVLGAYAAAGAQFLADVTSQAPMVGASGAISAVLGVYALLFSRQVVPKIGPIPSHVVRALWLGAAWIGFQYASGLMMAGNGYNIAIAAHIGGFIAGLIVARPMLAWVYRKA